AGLFVVKHQSSTKGGAPNQCDGWGHRLFKVGEELLGCLLRLLGLLLSLQQLGCVTTTLTQRLDPLLEENIELLDGTTLKKHVPVGTWGLDRLGLNALTLDEGAELTVLAHPLLGDFRIISEGDLVDFSILGPVFHKLAWCQVVIPVGFITHGAHAAATKNAICHLGISPLPSVMRISATPVTDYSHKV